jgi:predicted nucleic acid-binding protein
MIVVSNTTPLNYLILCETAQVLPAIFGSLSVPSAVIEELSHPRSPEAVRNWSRNAPEWIAIQNPTHVTVSKLGRGESAAISLALELRAGRILIDDRDGAREATRHGLNVTGTLAILVEAGRLGLIDIEDKIRQLKRTSFRASDELYQTVLERVRTGRTGS